MQESLNFHPDSRRGRGAQPGVQRAGVRRRLRELQTLQAVRGGTGAVEGGSSSPRSRWNPVFFLQGKLKESRSASVSPPACSGNGEVWEHKRHTTGHFNRLPSSRSAAKTGSWRRSLHGDYLVGRPGVNYDFLSLMREQRGSSGPSRLSSVPPRLLTSCG